jgi:hypothetical protein
MRFPFLLAPILLLAAPAGPAEESALAGIRSALEPVRAGPGANQDRDAGPELAPVKQALRAWVESRLPEPVDPNGRILDTSDYAALGRHLTAELDSAALTCGEYGSQGYRCAALPSRDEDERGYLGPIRIGSLDGSRYLVMTTSVGMRCGFDESAYVYEHRDPKGWRLLLAIEEKDYREKVYNPRNFLSIDVSPSGVAWDKPAPPPLVAALTFGPWCQSNWHMLATRLWRATPATTAPRPLLDREESLYMGFDFIAAEHLAADNLLVEFQGDSADSAVLVRPHVLHYRVGSGDSIERIGPVALSPQDFLDEWIRSRGSEAWDWIDDKARKRLAPVHAQLGDLPFGMFDPSKRCRPDPTLWQVGFTPDKDGKDLPPLYFKIRWMPPYRFSLVDSSPRPFVGCDVEESMPDNVGSLFPLQGWTG